MSIEIISDVEIRTVPARAAEWIAGVLREADMPSAPFLVAMENNSQLDLRLLNVKQLKRISNEMSTRTIQNLKFRPPKSGARKAELISSIVMFFHENAPDNNIYNILNGSTLSLTSAASVTNPSPSSNSSMKRRSRVSKKSAVARKSLPKVCVTKVRKSPLKAKKCHMTKKSPAKPKSIYTLTHATISADATLARSLQNRSKQEESDQLTNKNTRITGSNGYKPRGDPLANSHLQNNHIGNGAIVTVASTGCIGGSHQMPGLNRPGNHSKNSTKSKSFPVKVKKEPSSQAATSRATYVNTSANAEPASAAEENFLQPRNSCESNMVASLREMGFTSTREILTALRAVAADREKASIMSSPNNGFGRPISTEWSHQVQVEAAMMWIISQREEVAEAQKLDAARISSEQADAAMEQLRRQEMEQQLKNADVVELIGCTEEDDLVENRSRHFPCSVLLRNQVVQTVLSAVASGPGKDQVIRVLSLEKNAVKWYGTVLPFAYFEYVLCPRFESWAGESAQKICKRLIHECDQLEKAMFNLSEQEEGGVGNVPKVFLAAQREANKKGKPISAINTSTFNEDDVEVLQVPGPSTTVYNSQSLRLMRDAGSQPVEVINIM